MRFLRWSTGCGSGPAWKVRRLRSRCGGGGASSRRCVGGGSSRRRSRVPAGARVGGGAALGRVVVVGGWGLVPCPLPLSGAVAFAGSRLGSPWSPAPVVAVVLAAGGSVRVGCARGVDQCVRSAAPSAVVVSASAPRFSHLPRRAALAHRTIAVVSVASALAVFPPPSGLLGAGSALAFATALEHSLPVWRPGPRPAGSGWSPCSLGGVSGWLWLPTQTSLF